MSKIGEAGTLYLKLARLGLSSPAGSYRIFQMVRRREENDLAGNGRVNLKPKDQLLTFVGSEGQLPQKSVEARCWCRDIRDFQLKENVLNRSLCVEANKIGGGKFLNSMPEKVRDFLKRLAWIQSCRRFRPPE